MAGDARLTSSARRKLRAELGALWAAGERPCAKCGRAIAYSLGWDLDEIVPRMRGGDPLDRANLQPAHIRCNRSAGATMGNRARGQRADGMRSTASRRLDRSRDW